MQPGEILLPIVVLVSHNNIPIVINRTTILQTFISTLMLNKTFENLQKARVNQINQNKEVIRVIRVEVEIKKLNQQYLYRE